MIYRLEYEVNSVLRDTHDEKHENYKIYHPASINKIY